MAGFDALVLAKALDIKIGSAKLIYGDNATTFKLRTNTVSREINKAIGAVAALLSAPGPPNLALNRHCPVCEFRDDCRRKAVERASNRSFGGMSGKHLEIRRFGRN
jgi:predicted RecB family nuclease